eukprot:1623065-Rhodomonas_salina.2
MEAEPEPHCRLAVRGQALRGKEQHVGQVRPLAFSLTPGSAFSSWLQRGTTSVVPHALVGINMVFMR